MIYSKEFCYLLGAYLGDGNLEWTRLKDGSKAFRGLRLVGKEGMNEILDAGMDWYIQNIHVPYLNENFVKTKKYRTFEDLCLAESFPKFQYKKVDGKTETYYHLRLRGKRASNIAEYFDNLCGSTKEKHFPEFIYQDSVENKLWFLAGLFDTDGSITTEKIKFGNMIEDLVVSTQQLLKEFEIYSYVSSEKARCNGIDYGLFFVLNIGQMSEIQKFREVIPLQKIDSKIRINNLCKVPK